MILKRIAVFCASSIGNDEEYISQAKLLGRYFATHHIELVYGGAKVGIMGVVADSVLENGGKVIGVIPAFLTEREIRHTRLTELIIVNSMHERKLKMHDLSDAFIALPGGFGTLEELFEILTWSQLGLHKKPIGLLNVNGFYNSLLNFIDLMHEKNLLSNSNHDLLLKSDNIDELIELLNR
jgi:uncharacterized protein (TIGR00730 family)